MSLIGLFALVGFVLGTGNAVSSSRASSAEKAAYSVSYKRTSAEEFPIGLREGRRAGRKGGRREGQRRGATQGARAGERDAASQRQDQQSAQQLTQDDIWCDSDGYCLQKSPGAGGPPCPPNTVENAGGVVCVPDALIER